MFDKSALCKSHFIALQSRAFSPLCKLQGFCELVGAAAECHRRDEASTLKLSADTSIYTGIFFQACKLPPPVAVVSLVDVNLTS